MAIDSMSHARRASGVFGVEKQTAARRHRRRPRELKKDEKDNFNSRATMEVKHRKGLKFV
jgi:hypothetical protein